MMAGRYVRDIVPVVAMVRMTTAAVTVPGVAVTAVAMTTMATVTVAMAVAQATGGHGAKADDS